MRANIDAFVASVAMQCVGLDILEIGAGVLDTNRRAFDDSNHYRKTDRDTLDITGEPNGLVVDMIVATEVFEHVPDTQRALTNCHAMLRPGGALLVTVPWEYPEHGDEDYWRFSELGIDLLLTSAGFVIERRSNAYVGEQKTNIFRLARKPEGT